MVPVVSDYNKLLILLSVIKWHWPNNEKTAMIEHKIRTYKPSSNFGLHNLVCLETFIAFGLYKVNMCS